MRLFAAALCLLLARPGAGAGVDAKRRELDKIQEQLGQTKRELEALGRQEEALDTDLRQLKDHSESAGRKMEELKGRMRAAERKKSELKLRIASLKTASGSWRSQAVSELRRYAMRESVPAGGRGERGLWSQALARRALLEKTALLSQLQGASRKTELAEEETRRRASELMNKSLLAQKEQKESQRQYEVKQEAYVQTKEKTAAALLRASELEESAKALNALIDRFIRSSKTRALSKTALDIPRHSLAWPVDGAVTATFGKEKNPDLGTWVIHQGIHLATAAGARVSAIEDGKVIFAGPFRSYGQVVIVDHGAGFYSIYGELGRISSAKGKQVSAGEALAQAGSSAGRGTVYLELRHGSQALDPLLWLRKK